MKSTSHTSPLPAIDELLSHRGTMQLLDRIVTYEKQFAVAKYVPRSDAWYADSEGNMPGWIGIELMAQTVAAHVGMTKQQSGMPVKQGVLLGTRRYNASVTSFPADKALLIHATVSFNDESGLGAYECRIFSNNDHELATATLKVYEPDDFDAFLKRAMDE